MIEAFEIDHLLGAKEIKPFSQEGLLVERSMAHQGNNIDNQYHFKLTMPLFDVFPVRLNLEPNSAALDPHLANQRFT